jgi:hypothetical protein
MPRLDRISSNNTTISDHCGTLVVTLHKTAIFQKRPDGTIVLNSGGWRTATTRTRMTQCFYQLTDSRYAVGQRKGAWEVTERDPANNFATIRTFPFYDGIELPA